MFAFIQRLFQRTPKPPAAEKPQKPSQEFFLAPDEAKTLGNIDYMRTARTVRKTFPKMVGTKKEVLEIVESISATEKVRVNEPTPEVIPESSAVPTSTEPIRRRSDDTLDRFRSMARDIRK